MPNPQKNTPKPALLPRHALVLIRQILKGEGEYAAVAERGDQHDAISEIVDQVLGEEPAPLSPDRVENAMRHKRSQFNALLDVAEQNGYWVKEVSGEVKVYEVSNSVEALGAVFREELSIVTFEAESQDPNVQGPTFWVKLNTNPREGFFHEWSGDAKAWAIVSKAMASYSDQTCVERKEVA